MPSDVRSHIDRLWERLWAGGIANPLVAIEQVSYLLLLKRLEDRSSGPERWAMLSRLEDQSLLEWSERNLIEALRESSVNPDFQSAMQDAVFAMPKASLVRECVDVLDAVLGETGGVDESAYAEVFEELLVRFSLSGRSGQFRTPRPLIDAVVRLIDPRPGERVFDPAAGTAGYLTQAVGHAERFGQPPLEVSGYDLDPGIVRLGLFNLICHNAPSARMLHQDSLSAEFIAPPADVLMTTPPFTGTIDPSDVDPALELRTGRAELLFLERCRLEVARQDARAAIVVPEGVLFGVSNAHVEARRRLLEHADLRAIAGLPVGSFRPYANVKTAIVLFRAGGPTREVVFAPAPDVMESQEAALGAMSEAIIAELDGEPADTEAARLHQDRLRRVPLEDIADRGWSLAASTYLADDVDGVADDDPHELIGRIDALERQIVEEIGTIRSLLKGAT